jgi:DNA-directed RNA polymerase specialized sigma24 family protein
MSSSAGFARRTKGRKRDSCAAGVRLAVFAVRQFPDTRASIVTALASEDSETRERATGLVIEAYRAPVIAVLERKWNLQPADAEDLAHDFFAQALTHDWLARYDAGRGRFRTFLRTCLFAFAATAHEAAGRKKRGGDVRHVSLDDASAVSTDDELATMFEREWTRSVLSIALDALRRESIQRNRESSWQVFEAYEVGRADGARPTYDALARELGIPVTQVTNYLTWARGRFREHVLATVRSLTASDEEYRDEVRSLLGPNVK